MTKGCCLSPTTGVAHGRWLYESAHFATKAPQGRIGRGAALFVPWHFARAIDRIQLQGNPLAPGDITKFATPLLIPPVMPRAGTILVHGGKPIDYYEISMRQFPQQVLPAGLPPTTVWGYGAVRAEGKRGLLHHAPSLTIEARWNRPVRVKWINDLVDAEGSRLPHLPAGGPDAALANPLGGTDGRDYAAAVRRHAGPVPGSRSNRDARPRRGERRR